MCSLFLAPISVSRILFRLFLLTNEAPDLFQVDIRLFCFWEFLAFKPIRSYLICLSFHFENVLICQRVIFDGGSNSLFAYKKCFGALATFLANMRCFPRLLCQNLQV